MRTLFFLAAAFAISCGGMPSDRGPLAAPPPDSLQESRWPDAVDLGVVVSSELDPTADVPPPPDARPDPVE